MIQKRFNEILTQQNTVVEVANIDFVVFIKEPFYKIFRYRVLLLKIFKGESNCKRNKSILQIIEHKVTPKQNTAMFEQKKLLSKRKDVSKSYFLQTNA